MKKTVFWIAAFVALAVPSLAQVLPEIPAQQVGFSQDRLERIKPAMEKHIAKDEMAGGIGLIARRGKIAYFESWGMADREAAKPMRKDTIVRLYSMTKAVTAVAVMILYEEGRFSLSDPVSKYLPEFSDMKVAVEKTDAAAGRRIFYTVPAERPTTILDLLRHTSGLDYAGPRDQKGELIYRQLGIQGVAREGLTLAEMMKRLATVPLLYQPGTTFNYGLSIDVLGRLVEVVSGQSLDQFFADRIFEPLHMGDTGFYVPEAKWDRLAVLYSPNRDGTVSRSTDAIQQDGYKKKPDVFMGGAGLASTTMDYGRFIQMLLNGGELGGARILSPKTVELMRSDHLGSLPRAGGALAAGFGFGLTFAVSLGPGQTGSIGSAGEYYWAGAAGTVFWIDPKEQMIGVFMIQNFMDQFAIAKQFRQLAYQAIVDLEK